MKTSSSSNSGSDRKLTPPIGQQERSPGFPSILTYKWYDSDMHLLLELELKTTEIWSIGSSGIPLFMVEQAINKLTGRTVEPKHTTKEYK